MKKITWIVLFACGLTISSNAQTSAKTETTSQNTEASVSDNNLFASTADIKTTESNNSVSNPIQEKGHSKGRKKWKDRTIGGKILICTGVGAFVILCVLFGTD